MAGNGPGRLVALYGKIDCGLPDKPEIVEVGPLAELAYIRCCLRSRAALTDGLIDRRVIGIWLDRLPGRPETHMKKLCSVGLLEDLGPIGWKIPTNVWSKWNPSRAEVQQKRDDEADRKRRWRESRAHSENGDTA
jgi:hypothetical protein